MVALLMCDSQDLSPEMAAHYAEMLLDPDYKPQMLPKAFLDEWRKAELERLYAPNPFRLLTE